MRKTCFFTGAVFCVLFTACAPSSNAKKETPVAEVPDANAVQVAGSFNNWWTYQYNHIDFTNPYTTQDTSGVPVSRDSFLQMLTTGKCIALRLLTADSSLKYRLYPLPASADPAIASQMAVTAKEEYGRFKREGTALPGFNFTDLNGQEYDRSNMQGKWLVLKCWFIGCKPCVAEMPELNRLVKEFSNRKDVVFLSLAFDGRAPLKNFLTATAFDYAVVPNRREYMMNQLGVTGYPTHILVNGQGNIVKITNRQEQFTEFFRRAVGEGK
jgi:thiol-disulfide isomerase/thioredoxin